MFSPYKSHSAMFADKNHAQEMFTRAHPLKSEPGNFSRSSFSPNSYLQGLWNRTVHGKESQIPIADFNGCCHLFPCERTGPCVIVTR